MSQPSLHDRIFENYVKCPGSEQLCSKFIDQSGKKARRKSNFQVKVLTLQRSMSKRMQESAPTQKVEDPEWIKNMHFMKLRKQSTLDKKRQKDILDHTKKSTKELLFRLEQVGKLLKEMKDLEEARKRITGTADKFIKVRRESIMVQYNQLETI